MARQLRIEFEGAFYHVTSRGNQRKQIYWDNRDSDYFFWTFLIFMIIVGCQNMLLSKNGRCPYFPD